MSFVYDEKCKEFGLDIKKVTSIVKRLSKAAKEADELGLYIFGGSGSGDLRFGGSDIQGPGHSVVADLDGTFDGGAGGDHYS